MALENFNCPQFVDFTSNDAFNIHDGADFCFEKGVVGELDLGDFGCKTAQEDERRDSGEMERLIAVLKNSTNLACNGSSQTPEAVIMCSPKLPTLVKHEPASSPHAVAAHEPEEDKENVSRTPTKPMEIAPQIANIEKCSAIQMATAVFKIESSSGESTTIATSVTTVTNTPDVGPAKQPGSGKSSNPLMRIRTSSNTEKLAKQGSSTPGSASSSSHQSLVKKTIAKMTAAFKTSSKPAAAVAAPGPVDHNSLRSRLTSKKSTATTRHEGPMRVEYEKPTAVARNLSPSNQSSATNRRCSSVPRTLREKQALVRSGAIEETEHVVPPTATTTLGEKIQNFFSSSHSSNLNTLGTSSSSSSKRQPSVKAKENPIKDTRPSKLPSISTNPNGGRLHGQDRRRSRSCNESIANKLKHKTRTESGNSVSTNGDDSNHGGGSSGSRMNTSRPVQASPGLFGKAKPRQRSADRAPQMPLYQGVKFIPKIGSKLPAATSSGHGLLSQRHHMAEDVLKTRPLFMQKKEPVLAAAAANPVAKSANTGIQIVANKLNSSANSSGTFTSRGVAKSSSFKQSTFKPAPKTVSSSAAAANTSKVLQTSQTENNSASNLNSTVCLNSNAAAAANSTALEHGHESVLGARNLNESASSIQTNGTNMSGMFGWSRDRKKSETSARNINHSGFLHTELRAQKRQEFEMTLKEKDRIVANLKRDMEAEKLRKQQEEIQKIRAQNTFRSRPIKHYKPVEIKPSEKPLTDPRSPQFGAAASNRTSRTNLHTTTTTGGPYTKQSSGSNITAPSGQVCDDVNALLDAPINKTVSGSSFGGHLRAGDKCTSQQDLH